MGTSWKTSVMGYVLALLAVVQEMMGSGQAFPTTAKGWITYFAAVVIAVMGRLAKDADVSNAPKPLPEAGKVG